MGNKYLHDLADVIRRSGFPVIEVDGWQDRARGSGGFEGSKPDHVMCHHTASGSGMDGWGDVEYMTFNHSDAPLCNLYLERSGTWYVCAGGATNTNGSGDCSHLSPDTMNSSAIGIEAGNNGVGEQWPNAQQDSYVAGVRALCDHYGIGNDRVHGHAEWAPSRKIDMAGNSRYASGGNTWDFNKFRNDVAGSKPAPGPGPTPGGDAEVFGGYWILKDHPTGAVYALYSNGTKIWMRDPDMLREHQALTALNQGDTNIYTWDGSDGMFRAFGPIVGPRPPGTDEYGV